MEDCHESKQFSAFSMSELNTILEKKGSIHEFLSDLVMFISQQMFCPVCSVFLYDSGRDSLVLRATCGLNSALVNNLELKVGEGITGKSFQSAVPIREGRASQSSFFRAIPESCEEQYEAFLAVPIRRGTRPIGVITLQHEKLEYFTPNHTSSLRAIASQLATILDDAVFLMELSQEHIKKDSKLPPILEGVGIGKGICIGQSVVFRKQARNFQKLEEDVHHSKNLSMNVKISPDSLTEEGKKNISRELTKFAGSLRTTKEELEDIQKSLGTSIAEAADIIFSAHMLMLRDVNFSDAMQEKIQKGCSAKVAIRTIVNDYVDLFSLQSNPRVQEKAQDVLDLGHRLIKNLDRDSSHTSFNLSGHIVVLADTFPSEIVRFAAEGAEGLVMLGGGETAHIALLARSLNLPSIFVKETAILDLEDNIPLVIDVETGRLLIDPSKKILKDYAELKHQKRQESSISISIPERCYTKDGWAVSILANVNLVQDVNYALEQRAEGIGLYRSEFPFLVQNDFPSEEKQKAIYEQVISPMGQREVIFRTLDAGGDKLIGYKSEFQEANPFLGFRGIRFSLANEEIFMEQIRAILRAGYNANIGILFPMIGSLEEFIDARNLVYKAMEELQRDGIPFCEKPKIGTMIELPSAAELSRELAEECDFLSIGTNDLIMYLLAIDRTNEMVGNLYCPYHPAILRVLNRIIEDVGSKISELSICGEAGSDPALIPFFIGRGIRKLSVSPKKISRLKNYVGTIKGTQAESIADEMLSLKTISDIKAFIKEEILGDNQYLI